uniref:Histidine kinase n=1 Tax=Eutreptiella gymnastica TaxID=73025 RepID=A0A7S1NEN4_9EUGL
MSPQFCIMMMASSESKHSFMGVGKLPLSRVSTGDICLPGRIPAEGHDDLIQSHLQGVMVRPKESLLKGMGPYTSASSTQATTPTPCHMKWLPWIRVFLATLALGWAIFCKSGVVPKVWAIVVQALLIVAFTFQIVHRSIRQLGGRQIRCSVGVPLGWDAVTCMCMLLELVLWSVMEYSIEEQLPFKLIFFVKVAAQAPCMIDCCTYGCTAMQSSSCFHAEMPRQMNTVLVQQIAFLLTMATVYLLEYGPVCGSCDTDLAFMVKVATKHHRCMNGSSWSQIPAGSCALLPEAILLLEDRLWKLRIGGQVYVDKPQPHTWPSSVLLYSTKNVDIGMHSVPEELVLIKQIGEVIAIWLIFWGTCRFQSEIIRSILGHESLIIPSETPNPNAGNTSHTAGAMGSPRCGSNRSISDVASATKLMDDLQKTVQAEKSYNGFFLQAMSHELRTPMATMMGCTELLRISATDEQLEHLKSMEMVAKNGLNLVDNLLDWAFLMERRPAMQFHTFPVQALLDQVVLALGTKSSHKITAKVDPSVPANLIMDKAKLLKILCKIMENSITHTPNGCNITVTVKVQNQPECLPDRTQGTAYDKTDGAIRELKTHVLRVFSNMDLDVAPPSKLWNADSDANAFNSDSSNTNDHPRGGQTDSYPLPKGKGRLVRGSSGSPISSADGLDRHVGASLRQCTNNSFSSLPSASKARKPLNYIVFEVVDDGAGIPQEHKALVEGVFEPFMNLYQGSKRTGQVGLGLAICSKMMRAMNGVMKVESPFPANSLMGTKVSLIMCGDLSNLGNGLAAFAQRLGPRIVAAGSSNSITWTQSNLSGTQSNVSLADSSPHGNSVTTNTGTTMSQDHVLQKCSRSGQNPLSPCLEKASIPVCDPNTVLVAEDTPPLQHLIRVQLSRLGYKAVICPNGKAVLETLQETWYPLILMDCHMPVMDGWECSSCVRQLEQEGRFFGQPRIKIVALTADGVQGTEERCLAAGMDQFILKPINLDKLRSLLSSDSPEAPTCGPSTSAPLPS